MARPFLYLGLCLSSGIYLASRFPPAPAFVAVGLLTCLAAAWPAYLLKRNTASLALALLAAAFLGAGVYGQAEEDYERNAVRKLNLPAYADFVGRLYRSPSLGVDRTALFLRVENITFRGKDIAVRGNLRVSVLHPSAYPPPFELKTGDRVKVSAQRFSARGFRNFGSPGPAELRKGQKIHVQAVAKSVRLVEKLPGPERPSPARLASSLHLAIEHRIEAHFSSPDHTALSSQGAVLEALLLGARGRMDRETATRLQGSGLYHLIAISGAHIGIISFLLFSLLKAFRLPRRPSYGILIVFLLLYAMIVEGRASVMRATIMALTYLLGKLLWEKAELLNTISFSACIILLFNPLSLFEAGFEMTYAATLSIILFYPRVSKLLPRLPLKAGHLLALSLTAQLGVIPLVAHLFHRVTLSSLLLNIPAIPLVGLIMASGFAFLAVSPVCPALTGLLSSLIKVLIDVFLWLSRSLDAVPGLSYRIPSPPPVVFLFYYLFLLLILLRPRFKGQRFLASSVFTLFLAVLITYPFPPRSSRSLRVTFLDVGQGDSILVEFPGRRKMLVDGGGAFDSSFDVGEQVVSPFLWRCGIKKLDHLVLTHSHPDHLNGLVAVARNFSVDDFWEAFSPQNSPAYEELKQNLSPRSRRRRVFRGFSVREGEVSVEVLHPEESPPFARKPENDDSLVLKLTADGISVLLAADIGRSSERAIMDSGIALRSQVLKSPHHGSRTSSSTAFLAAVEPKVVVVSSGRAFSGVPHPEVLERYEAAGVLLLRTDRDGAVEIEVRSPGLRVLTASSGPPAEEEDDIL